MSKLCGYSYYTQEKPSLLFYCAHCGNTFRSTNYHDVQGRDVITGKHGTFTVSTCPHCYHEDATA